MSKTLWHTIKLEVPKEMINITKNDKVVVKKSLTKTNNISKSNKEPSIKIIPGDTNKPKIISDGKEWNIEELKLKMKKAKDLGKKNEDKELKKKSDNKILKSYVKKVGDKVVEKNLQKKNEIEKIKRYSRNQLEIIFKKIVGYKNNIDYFDSTNNKGANHTLDLNKYTDEDLIKQIKNFKENSMSINKETVKYLLLPEILTEEKPLGGGTSRKKGGKKNLINPNWKHPFKV
jgi:hypothetical protein